MELLSYYAFHTVQSTQRRMSLTNAESGRPDLNPVSRRPFPLQFVLADHAEGARVSIALFKVTRWLATSHRPWPCYRRCGRFDTKRRVLLARASSSTRFGPSNEWH